MKPRHKRLAAIGLGLAALGVAVALVLAAFQRNLVFFFTPSQVVAHEAPQGRTFRIGGPGTRSPAWPASPTPAISSASVPTAACS